MKKIINKNMQQQLAQALFGTIAVKIPLNKAGTFAAPIRATAKVVESLLKFANKRSFNLFVFASAVVLNAGVVNEAFSCTVQSGGGLKCNNTLYSGSWTCDTATATCTSNFDGQKVTYDPNTGIMTSYAKTDKNGYTQTRTYDGNGTDNSNVTGRTLYRNGQPVNGTVTLGKYTYTAENGVLTGYTQTNSDGSGYVHTYDPTTGKETSTAGTHSDGSGYVTTYDPTTGKETSYTSCSSYAPDGSCGGTSSGYVRTYDQIMGKQTIYTYCYSYASDGSCSGAGYVTTYDPTTGKETSYTSCSSYAPDGSCSGTSSGWVRTYDPITGKVTREIRCSSYASDGSCSGTSSGSVYTYDPDTGKVTRHTDCSSYAPDGSCQGSLTNYFYNPTTGEWMGDCKNNPCVTRYSGGYIAISGDGKGGYTKMYCTDNTFDDCTTTQYGADGKIIAEYDNDNQLIAKYDYDNSGNLAGTYDDQCVLQSCSSGHLEKNGSCISASQGCGAGYKQIENWCNHIQWTPAEAAAVLNDDNNNSVTITFRK